MNNENRKNPVSVILIAYNEAQTIGREVEFFYRAVVEKLSGSELIVAEDGSTDGTSEKLRDLAGRLPIKLIQGKERKGYKQAMLEAFRAASHPWIFFSDTGGKFNPEDFWRLEPYRSGFDLIIGAKFEREDQIYRRVITRVFNSLVRFYFGASVQDIDSGFRLCRRELALRAVDSPLVFQDLISSEVSLRMLALGARLKEVPVLALRREGLSRGMPPQKIPRVVVQVLRSFPRLKRELALLRKD